MTISTNPNVFNKYYHEKPWKLSTYEGIIKKLVSSAKSALKEEKEILDAFKRVIILTKGKPKFFVKQNMGEAKIVQRGRSTENRDKFQRLLSSLQDEIRGSIPELQWMYDHEIDLGMEKYYSTEKDLELKAGNLGRRYDNANFEKISTVFINAVSNEDIPVLYYVDKYSPEKNIHEGFIKPWKEKTASKLNPNLGKIKVLLTQFVNLPSLLSKVIGNTGGSRNFSIPEGTPVGEANEDKMLFTLLQLNQAN